MNLVQANEHCYYKHNCNLALAKDGLIYEHYREIEGRLWAASNNLIVENLKVQSDSWHYSDFERWLHLYKTGEKITGKKDVAVNCREVAEILRLQYG